MPIVTVRPDATLQKGGWAIVGPPGMQMHEALNDDSDLTYVETAVRLQNDDEIGKLSIQDFDVPDGAKIYAVRARVRVQKIQATTSNPDPPTPRPGCGFHRHGFIEDLIRFIFALLFGFRCPRKPPPKNPTDPPTPPEWTTVDLAYYLEQPGGGEWTEQTFDDFFVSLQRLDDETVTLRISEVLVDLDYNEAPVVTVTGPVGPLTDITLPTATWTFEDAESDRQAAFWVRIFEESVYTLPDFDPAASQAFDESIGDGTGWVKGDDTFWTVNRDHPNGTYRAYVKTQQVWNGIGTHESAWAYWEWQQAVPGPPQPSLTAVFEPDLNRNRIDLHEGGEHPETDTYNIEYSDNLGWTWDLLRGGRRVDIDDQRDSRVYDYEAPLNRSRAYRAAAFRVLNSILVTSGYSNTATAIPHTDRWWLKDVLVPALNMPLYVLDMSRKQPRARGEFKPLVAAGARAARAIVVQGPAYGEEGDLLLAFIPEKDGTEKTWTDFRNLIRDGRPLLLQAPHGEGWYVSLGDVEHQGWRMRADRIRYRKIKVRYIEVDPPPDLTLVGLKR